MKTGGQTENPQRLPAGETGGALSALGTWMQELVPYGIFTTDRELRITSWNDWLVSHSGLAREDAMGRSLLELFPAIEARRLGDRYLRALEGEISVLSSALHKYLLPFPTTAPGSELPHMLQTARIAPLPADDRVVGTITMIEDVTQREFQASILQRQQEIDRLLSSSLATLLQSHDPAGEMPAIFALISPALALDAYVSYLFHPANSTLGLSEASGFTTKQRELLATVPISDAEKWALVNGAGASTTALDHHLAALRHTGVRGHCIFPLVVGDRLIGLLTFGNFQRETIPPTDAAVLARIARYVAIALDRVQRERETAAASRAKDDFLAALSHELRTPLNPVLLVASDSATEPAYPEQAREAFRVIEKNAMLEARLIDDLLDLTRIEHGKLLLHLESVDVHAVLHDALETVRPDAVEHTLRVEVNLQAARTRVFADSGRLQQVFWNVLKNAVKFTPKGGKVSITTTINEAEEEIIVEVADSGMGMAPHEVERVFGAFSQGDHADRGAHRFGGLGLGLAISRKLVELHQGRILAASAGKNQGSTFTIALPLRNSDPGRGPNGVFPARESEQQARHSPIGTGCRILLVEDHDATRRALVRILEQRKFHVVAAASAEAALTEASHGSFDLVLSDIGLPDGDGYGLMEKLKTERNLKGIALSGYGMEADLARSKAAGFLAHLTKPINMGILDRVLENVLAMRK